MRHQTHPSLKAKRGQNTAEYLIMLTLVAIGSIAAMAAFGKTIHSKFAVVAAAIVGDDGQYTAAKQEAVNKATAGIQRSQKGGDIKVRGIDNADLISQ